MSAAIPEDVHSAAFNVLGAQGRWGDVFKLVSSTPEAVEVIARALMAERERCAHIAKAEYETRFENADGYSASRVHDYVIVARAIERSIRNPTGE